MRLFELEQQSNGHPEIFLDMDGVLADFFSEYAKLAGVPADVKSGRADYRNIPAELREPVIAQMRGTDFFHRLPKFPSADKLVDIVVQVFGYYNICSSPLRGDHTNSEAMKRAWIAENLNPQPRVIRITGRNGKYAKQQDGTPNILVDDRNSVLTEWEQSGGIGIKYQADEDGLDTVVSGIRRAFEIIKGQREHTPQNIQSKDYGKMIASPSDDKEKTNESTFTDHEQRLTHFSKWVCKKIDLEFNNFRIKFSDKKDTSDMTYTGKYNNDFNTLWVYTGNRNLVDIMRTLAHELVHRKQDTEDRVEGVQTGPGHPLEQEADVVAGTLMKLYAKKFPEIIE